MLYPGHPMFLFVPNAGNERILYPGTVIESDRENFTAEFEKIVPLASGIDVNAYGEIRGKFHQQGAIVAEVRQVEPNSVVAFARVGEPVSAENRQMYRVCVVNSGITVRLANQNNCNVVDISPAGFAAVAPGDFKMGWLVEICLDYEGKTVAAMARVQTIKERPDGKYRYGFLVPQNNTAARRVLEAVSSSIQRLQLRRFAGAA
jgi:hypothetical protein